MKKRTTISSKNSLKKHLISIVLLVVASSLITNQEVKAETVSPTLSQSDTGYYLVILNGGTPVIQKNSICQLNEVTVYYAERTADIRPYIYNPNEDMSKLELSNEQLEYLKLIIHYGYDYKNHKENVLYYLATQELILEYVNNFSVEWLEILEYPLEYIDIESYKNEILSLIENHNLTPSISDSLKAQVGEIIELEDKNNVLSNYQIEPNENLETEIKNNKLIIKLNPNYLGTTTIILSQKEESEEERVFYYYDNYKKTLSTGKTKEPSSFDINIEVEGTYLKIIKVDSTSQKNLAISGLKFKIKDLSTNKYITYYDKYINQNIDTFETDNKGEILIPIPISYGIYELEELEPPTNYNSENITFTIDSNSNFYKQDNYNYLLDIKHKSQIIKSKIEINKTGDIFVTQNNTFNYDIVPLENIEYRLIANTNITTLDNITHYKKDEIVTTVTTNAEGHITIDNIYPGSYCLKETKTNPNYITDLKDYCFILDKNGYTLNITTNLKRGNIIVSVTDAQSKHPLKNTTIELYTENNKLISTNITDAEGLIKINNLPLGTYYLKEKNISKYYQTNDEKKYFILEELNETITLNLINYKIQDEEIINTGINLKNTPFIIAFTISSITLLIYIYNFLQNIRKPNHKLIFDKINSKE